MGHEQDFLDSLHVMEVGMQHFFTKAMTAKANNGKPEIIDANMLQAVSIAEKIAPYRHARLSAMKLAGDPNATKEPGDDASLEELKRIVEFHLERIAPVLDLKVIPINGTDTEPRDGIANCDAPQGRAGNDAGAPHPSADYVPIKDADRIGASDPMTALLVYFGGTGVTTVSQACEPPRLVPDSPQWDEPCRNVRRLGVNYSVCDRRKIAIVPQ
jgi:hypothetical protein